jgi:hypothetical protein
MEEQETRKENTKGKEREKPIQVKRVDTDPKPMSLDPKH